MSLVIVNNTILVVLNASKTFLEWSHAQNVSMVIILIFWMAFAIHVQLNSTIQKYAKWKLPRMMIGKINCIAFMQILNPIKFQFL